jgi:hypothetical protein
MRILIIIITLFFVEKSKAQYPEFNQYVPQLPVDAMVNVGIYKQQLYESRSNWVQNEIYRLQKIVMKLFNEKTMPPNFDAVDFRKQLWDKFTEYINSISRVDFADNYQFNSVKNSINSYENWFYENYNNVIRRQ